jgi:pimeloyl-ACP methyl ester carboxylesterase
MDTAPFSPESSSVPMIRAVVHAGGLETSYLRMGHGPTVLVLGVPPEARVTSADTRVALADLSALAESFRVIIPLVPPPEGRRDAERWLRDLIDGLGLDRPVLLAPAELAPLLLRMARRDPDRIGPTLVVPLDAASAGARLPFGEVALLRSLLP